MTCETPKSDVRINQTAKSDVIKQTWNITYERVNRREDLQGFEKVILWGGGVWFGQSLSIGINTIEVEKSATIARSFQTKKNTTTLINQINHHFGSGRGLYMLSLSWLRFFYCAIYKGTNSTTFIMCTYVSQSKYV